MIDPRHVHIDHLVYVTPDVDTTARDLAARLGVHAEAGGHHPAWGTRNALIPLGPRRYLEILGPGPVPGDRSERPLGLDRLSEPRLVTWCARYTGPGGLSTVVDQARAAGTGLGDVNEGRRRRADGAVLTWESTDFECDREGGVVPFFIDWGNTPHPAGEHEAPCRLAGLWIGHPEPERITRVLSQLGFPMHVRETPTPSVSATVHGPTGSVLLN